MDNKKNLEKVILLINQASFSDAIILIETILRDDDKNFKLYYLLGICHFKLENLDLAELNLKKSINLKKNFVDALHNLGIVYNLKKKFNDAQNCFLKSLEIEPKNVESLIELGRNYEMTNNFNDAKKYYFEALRLENNNKTANGLLGRMLISIGFQKEGMNFLKKSTGIVRFNERKFEILR